MYSLCMITLLLSALILKISCTAPTASSSSSSAEDNSKQVDQYATEMIKNDKTREVYVNCLLDKGPCANDAADIKKMFPEAVERGCAKCTEMHKKIIEKMMLHLKEKQPDILKQVTAKFDPKGEFMKTFLTKLMNKTNESGQQNGQPAPAKTQPSKSPNEQANVQTQQPKPIRN